MVPPTPMLARATRSAICALALSLLAVPAHGEPALFSTAQAVPEPATLLLLGAGLVILWWGLKRKR